MDAGGSRKRQGDSLTACSATKKIETADSGELPQKFIDSLCSSSDSGELPQEFIDSLCSSSSHSQIKQLQEALSAIKNGHQTDWECLLQLVEWAMDCFSCENFKGTEDKNPTERILGVFDKAAKSLIELEDDPEDYTEYQEYRSYCLYQAVASKNIQAIKFCLRYTIYESVNYAVKPDSFIACILDAANPQSDKAKQKTLQKAIRKGVIPLPYFNNRGETVLCKYQDSVNGLAILLSIDQFQPWFLHENDHGDTLWEYAAKASKIPFAKALLEAVIHSKKLFASTKTTKGEPSATHAERIEKYILKNDADATLVEHIETSFRALDYTSRDDSGATALRNLMEYPSFLYFLLEKGILDHYAIEAQRKESLQETDIHDSTLWERAIERTTERRIELKTAVELDSKTNKMKANKRLCKREPERIDKNEIAYAKQILEEVFRSKKLFEPTLEKDDKTPRATYAERIERLMTDGYAEKTLVDYIKEAIKDIDHTFFPESYCNLLYKNDNTILHILAHCPTILTVLLAKGILNEEVLKAKFGECLNKKNRFGKTPWEYAKQLGHSEYANRLLRAGNMEELPPTKINANVPKKPPRHIRFLETVELINYQDDGSPDEDEIKHMQLPENGKRIKNIPEKDRQAGKRNKATYKNRRVVLQ